MIVKLMSPSCSCAPLEQLQCSVPTRGFPSRCDRHVAVLDILPQFCVLHLTQQMDHHGQRHAFATCTEHCIEHNLDFEHTALVCLLEEYQCHQRIWLLHAITDRSSVAHNVIDDFHQSHTITSSDRSSFPMNTPPAFHRDSISG